MSSHVVSESLANVYGIAAVLAFAGILDAGGGLALAASVACI